MPFERQPHLVGELIELRPLREDDWPALFAVASDPLIWEQHPAKERCQEAGFRRFFDEALKEVGERDCCGNPLNGAAAGRGGAFAVIEKCTGRIIGSTRFHDYDAEKSQIEIGWTFLARSHWGGRYNREMKRLILDHAFNFVNTVYFLVDPGNLRSRTAMERLGAVNTGITHVRDAAGKSIEHLRYEMRKAT
jgi:N-acetyltransferase